MNFTIFHIPEDEKLLAALGVLVLRHGHLEHILKMTIRTLENLSIPDALEETKRKGPRQLRTRIGKEADKNFNPGATRNKLNEIMERSEKATEKRNFFVHNMWAYELDEEALILDENMNRHPLPTIQELEELSSEIKRIFEELNDFRLGKNFQTNKKLGVQ
ncbi:MAG: hypothetical protein ACE5ER_04750 [Nitrospinaceae bacterium]